MPETKLCAAEGCSFAASKKGSYCSRKHFYLLQKELGTVPVPKPKKAAASKPKKVAVTIQPSPPPFCEDPGDPLSITLRLTEAQCDAIFKRCNVEQKALAISAALHSVFAI